MTKPCSVKIRPIPTKARSKMRGADIKMHTRKKVSEIAKRYPKIIEWSDEDNCYIGSAPPLIGQSCHGPTEAGVLKQLQVIVEEVVEIILVDGNPFPEPLLPRKQTVAK